MHTFTFIKNKILEYLQKEVNYQGFYTDTKILTAVNDSVLYLTSKMAINSGGRWYDTRGYLPVAPGQTDFALPQNLLILKVLRIKNGENWQTIETNNSNERSREKILGNAQGFQIFGNMLKLDSPLDYVSNEGIEYEAVVHDSELAVGSTLPTQLNAAMCQYIVYRAIGILLSMQDKTDNKLQGYENQWFNVIENLINKRVSTSKIIREWHG